MEWPILFRHTKGMKVRLKHPLSNGVITMPAGTIGHITGGHHWSAIRFTSEPCPCCGIQGHVTRCDKYTFEPLEPAPSNSKV